MSVYDLNRIKVPDSPPEYEDHAGEPHFVPAPCQVACPIGTDAPSYIAYIWEEKWEQAFEAITSTNPFSSICGRVCDAPCEPACRRADSDGPLMIRNLKRYVMERVGDTYDPPAIPVTSDKSVAIIGAGPAGLTAAYDLCVAGHSVHVYEMSDRLGGMMIWGIPAFRLPAHIIDEDINRLTKRCPGLEIHLNTALGEDVTLAELKQRHDAVLLTIGAWWGKPMGIPGEDDPRVVDGVGFLRRINGGDRPEMPESVVVVGGGDVAMDACRAALRLPGCEKVKVVYRRGPDEIPARKIELEGAIKEGIEFIYNTQQIEIVERGNAIALRCLKTTSGEPDVDGRRRPVEVPGSEHDIACGMVIAAVGQKTVCDELDGLGMMSNERVTTDFGGMRTTDEQVFAAGDGAFGGSTIVMAMNHGQRAAYYVGAYLDGRDDPLPYRTPYRTRRVPPAEDIMWERFPMQEAEFFGVGKTPSEFPEIEATYDDETAKSEAARCYRCDAETGSSDYSVSHREDLFSMARTNPLDHGKHEAMLEKRLRIREDPFPEGRPASFDDLVFLPANLSRLVIDPYREACRVSTDLAGKLELEPPFLVTGFDEAPDEVRRAVAAGLVEANVPYLGRQPIGDGPEWLQFCLEGDEPNSDAAGIVHALGHKFRPVPLNSSSSQLTGLSISTPAIIEETLTYALDSGIGIVVLDGSGGLGGEWPELSGPPDLRMARDAVSQLRRMGKEEHVDLVWFGGVRSGTDAAKLIGLGCKVSVYGVQAGLAAGGEITADHGLAFSTNRTAEDRTSAIVNILKASTGEASMMARCTGKTVLQNIEPEDLRAITIATSQASGIPLAGTDWIPEESSG
jgi:NADPH-dependent glutamate synthase beta subunit-like oxidoreductase